MLRPSFSSQGSAAGQSGNDTSSSIPIGEADRAGRRRNIGSAGCWLPTEFWASVRDSSRLFVGVRATMLEDNYIVG